jgi:F420-dependent oxidoreductase-like protein
VVEGWHGVSYAKPLTRTREYIEIVRTIFERKTRLEYDGRIYQLPYQGDDATGLGKPLKSTLRLKNKIPIYLAAIGPKNVALAAEMADGWLPIFFAPSQYDELYRPQVEAGLAKAGKSMADFDIAPTVQVAMNDNLEIAYNALRPMLALYIGGMGSRDKNFYNDLAVRLGFEEAAAKIQELYLDGRQGEAMMAVPPELIDQVALVGPKERIKERLSLWAGSPINTLNLAVTEIDTLRAMVELVSEVA